MLGEQTLKDTTMQAAYNAYVSKVLEQMTSANKVSLELAKRMCKQNLQFLEVSYLNLSEVKEVAAELLAP